MLKKGEVNRNYSIFFVNRWEVDCLSKIYTKFKFLILDSEGHDIISKRLKADQEPPALLIEAFLFTELRVEYC